MDYRKYALNVFEVVQIIVMAMGITILIAILFYQSWWACFAFPIIYWILYKRIKEEKIRKRKDRLQEEFLSGIQVLSASIHAGLSIENAWKDVKKELAFMYGEDCDFCKEITEMTNQVSMNISIEKKFLSFAYRTGIEDIINFAEILDYAKKSGGNWKRIIETTIYQITEKQEAKREIMVLIAEKKMEQQIMNLMPLGMIFFLQIFSWDYMSTLYHNFLGVLCMSICLVLYGVAIFLSEKIMQIEV